MTRQILLIEDDDTLRTSLAQTIELAGMTAIATASFVQARRYVRSNFAGVILSDIRMPKQDGFDVLGHAQRTDPELPVILLTGHSDVPTATRALKEGAWDYLEKPCSTDRLEDVLTRALDHRALVLKSRQIERALLRNDAAAANFPGDSDASETLRAALRRVAGTRQHVHLYGADGAGKKRAAYAINQLSPEPCKFERINYAVPGASLAALRIAPDQPLDLSAKTVDRATASQQAELVALVRATPDLRLITSSGPPLIEYPPCPLTDNTDIAEASIEIRVPSLDERRTDLPVIFTTLLRQAARSLDTDMPEVPETVMGEIMARSWSGNLPELDAYAASFVLGQQVVPGPATQSLAQQMEAFEELVLIETLRRTCGQVVMAAKLLDVPRNTLYDRMARYDISPKRFRTETPDT